ncbi:MAG: type II toxin-antitoxin system PemK/MazF family toxin [Bacteroidota bacterium]
MVCKDFTGWTRLKAELHEQKPPPTFKEREIWWGSIGINIGHETDGKSDACNRPVLVVKKFNQRIFWGIPLTTKIKDSPHYYRFDFNGRQQCAMLTQLRLWDAKRLTHKMGRLAEKECQGIRGALQNYLA